MSAFADRTGGRRLAALTAVALLLSICLVVLTGQPAAALAGPPAAAQAQSRPPAAASVEPVRSYRAPAGLPPFDRYPMAYRGRLPSAAAEAGSLGGPALPAGGGDWDGYAVSYPCVTFGGAGYLMWYLGFDPAAKPSGWTMGRADSSDGTTWTKYAGNPVLVPGEKGAWDDYYRGQATCLNSMASSLSVVTETYQMWYSGGSDSGPWQIGYAGSSDYGATWNVYPEPVLPSGPEGSFDEAEASQPSVWLDGSGYLMWYTGFDADYRRAAIGYATSPDGLHWTKYAGNPVFEPGAEAAWDEGWVYAPSVVKVAGGYEMYYLSDGQMGRATSPDGINWTRDDAHNPVLDQAWDGSGLGGKTVLLEGTLHRPGQAAHKMWVSNAMGSNHGIGYYESDDGLTWNQPAANPVLVPGTPGLWIDVNYDHDWVEGSARPGSVVTVTVADGGGVKATAIGLAQGWPGHFATHNWEWAPEPPDIQPGDTVIAEAAGVTTTVDPVGRIEATRDLENDVVAGTLHVPEFAGQKLKLVCEAWIEDGPAIEIKDGVEADGGSFVCDFGAKGFDLQAQFDVGVRYVEPDGDSVIAVPPPIDLLLRVNYAHEWVEGDYEVGHTVWLTLTAEDSTTVKATIELTTQPIPWWNDRPGFVSNWNEPWVPAQPDIEPGDWVYGLMDSGRRATVQVGEIRDELDVTADTIAGTIHAPWFSGKLLGDCNVWENGGPGASFEADADGGAFSCDFGEMGWDLLPGQNVGVGYQEPDGDRVYNVFQEPAPEMQMEKWVEGNNQAAPGGRSVFTLRYRNQGEAAPARFIVTDTLPANTVYVADSSPVTPTIAGNQVSWTFGAIPPGLEGRFQVVVENSAAPSETLHNEAVIWAPDEWQTDNNGAGAEVHVVDGQPDLYVNKNLVHGRPVAGETLLYRIDYGNDGPVPSGPAQLTETLPPGTTVVEWYSWSGYFLWEEVGRNGQLVLEVPSIPAHWGDQLYLRLRLDAGVEAETELVNVVEIATAGDSDLNNNRHERSDWTGGKYSDAGAYKGFGWGQLLPGGEVEYWLNIYNHGNVAAALRVTDTLPANTSLINSRLWIGYMEIDFPPTQLVNGQAIWDLGVMEPGEWRDINVRVRIDGGAVPGAVLKNCVRVQVPGRDENPFNNETCVENGVNAAGPNLQVTKESWWDWEGQIHYRIRFRNVGATTVYSPTLVDTLPNGTSFSGNWWHDFRDRVDLAQNGQQLTWTFSRLEPTWQVNLEFQADLDEYLHGQQGRAYRNRVSAPLAGDVNPADNQADVTSYTGPDLFAEKWLEEGELRPGERITFAVRCGNKSPWPWQMLDGTTARLTEYLPAGMSYVAAYWPDGSQLWPEFGDPGDSQVAWEFGQLGGDDWRWFFVVVDLDDSLLPGTELVNRVTISERPLPAPDTDPLPENNSFELSILLERTGVYLPLVYKGYR